MRNKYSVKGLLCCAVLLARLLFLGVLVLVPAVSGFAMMVEEPRSFSLQDKSQEQVERKILPKIGTGRLLAEDQARGKDSQHQGPVSIAVAADVAFTLTNSGTWQTLADGRLWRLRIQSPGAKHLSLGISRFDLPEGAKLSIYDPGHRQGEGPFTARDRSDLGSLWTPLIEGDEIVAEVFVPAGVSDPVVEIGKVNRGYRGLGQGGPGGTESPCEFDVKCSLGGPYQTVEIPAVAMYKINSMEYCTGTLLNDTKNDHTPYFLTAYHCFSDLPQPTVDSYLAGTTVYWKFESPSCNNCGAHNVGDLSHPQTGLTYVYGNTTTDVLLLRLTNPIDSTLNVHYAGWDARGTLMPPAAAVGIHHPKSDVKAISLSNSVTKITTNKCSVASSLPFQWLVNWSQGGTEDNSSGSCLFDTTTHRCIGTLLGGNTSAASGCASAAVPTCGMPPACNSTSYYSWYAPLSASWSQQLATYLDNKPTGNPYNDGDPHITTVDGTHYNFQGAGEYVSLRNPSGLEIQTRQAPIATTFNPGADPHDGLATCVSLNTAVAAQVGKHRVTYEPNLSGQPDPSGLQLRVDGGDPIPLVTLGSAGLDLGDGGRIANTPAPGGLEIDFPDANALFVTPGWWASQRKWYLNVDILRHLAMDGTAGAGTGDAARAAVPTPSGGGLMGAVPQGSWLPALPDGTLVPMPPSYAGLYQTFGDTWRVTEKNSLFDYAPGTSTRTFTIPSCASTEPGRSSEKCWPPEIPQNPPPELPRCLIPGTTPAEPASGPVAQEACRQITGKNMHDDCIFDVVATGNPGFAQTYLGTQQFQNGATETTVKSDKDVTKYGRSVTFTATVVLAGSRGGAAPAGTVQFILDGSNAGNPLALDPTGRAAWSTSSLQAGIHQIAANYIPSTGSPYLASVSPKEIHVVLETFDPYMWLAILLLIIVLILIVWWYLRSM